MHLNHPVSVVAPAVFQPKKLYEVPVSGKLPRSGPRGEVVPAKLLPQHPELTTFARRYKPYNLTALIHSRARPCGHLVNKLKEQTDMREQMRRRSCKAAKKGGAAATDLGASAILIGSPCSYRVSLLRKSLYLLSLANCVQRHGSLGSVEPVHALRWLCEIYGRTPAPSSRSYHLLKAASKKAAKL